MENEIDPQKLWDKTMEEARNRTISDNNQRKASDMWQAYTPEKKQPTPDKHISPWIVFGCLVLGIIIVIIAIFFKMPK